MTFTFLLDDGRILEEVAEDKDSAYRQLCDRLGRSWCELHPHLEACLSPIET